MDEAKETTEPLAVAMHPGLLMAAHRGDHQLLEELLGATVQAAASSYVAVDIQQTIDCARLLLCGVSSEGNSVLHVIASSGDDQSFLNCARMVFEKARHLIEAPNKMGDTPLHCAARARNFKMLSCLVALLAGDGEDTSRASMQQVLREQNKRGETVLHEAVRFAGEATVRELMEADPELARVPTSGTSPLYQAILLGRVEIASLLHDFDDGLSYSGPDGQNSLHAAVLRGKETTDMVLGWTNQQLTTEVDDSGSTPLHFAAAADGPNLETARSLLVRVNVLLQMTTNGAYTAQSLLEANLSSAYQPDKKGALPVHVASAVGDFSTVVLLLSKCPECACARDAQGRTFLHVAVDKWRHDIVAYACRVQRFTAALNVQDNEGNTALHLAVQVGDLGTFRSLLRNRHVDINLANNKGQTPLDCSWSRRPAGINYRLDPRTRIHQMLIFADAKNGYHRWDNFEEKHIPKLNESEESKKMTEAAQVVGISSVLVATVTFAAAFTMPGGYRGDDRASGGTPTLAGTYAFNAFLIANTLAFCCSVLATFSLIYSGLASIGLYTRFRYFIISVALLRSSSRSLVVAFALGVYVVVAPVARLIAIATTLISSATLVYENRDSIQILIDAGMLNVRLGIHAWRRFGITLLSNLICAFWPYIIIFSLAALNRNKNGVAVLR